MFFILIFIVLLLVLTLIFLKIDIRIIVLTASIFLIFGCYLDVNSYNSEILSYEEITHLNKKNNTYIDKNNNINYYYPNYQQITDGERYITITKYQKRVPIFNLKNGVSTIVVEYLPKNNFIYEY